MSVRGAQRRYVSTLRIQLSVPASGGGRRQPTRPLHNLTASRKTGEGTPDSVAEGNGLLGIRNPPLFLEPLQDCLVDEGNDFTLRAVITGSQPISVSWLHNGKVVWYGKSSFIGREAILVVRECLPEDAGAYTCVAENASGKTSSSSAVCVKEMIIGVWSNPTQSSRSPPSCFLSPHIPVLETRGLCSPSSPRNTLEGCKLSQFGSPEILLPAHRKEVPVKRRSSSATVPPMKIVDPPDLVEVRAGGCARLSCVFKGSIPIVSCWTHNKKEVFEDSRLSIESSSKGSSLVISEAQPEDSGFYTLTARDRNSFAHHTLTLSVIERPQPPSSCPVVCVLSPDSVVLSWSGPCYDGGSALTGYLVEVLSLGPDQTGHWSELSANCKSTSLRVRSGLQPQGQYRFRVRACNAVGVSEPSEESQPIKMDAPAELQDEMTEYVNVTIDDKHKVTDHYNVLERLGTGRFGQVFRLTHKVTGHVCAGKFYKGRRTSEREAAKKEITLMNFLHHPKLVQCLAAYNNKPEIVMVMEFIAGGELFERIVDDNFEHTEPTSVGYMCQILQGIEFMHKQSIVHLDLKPENIVCVNRTGTQVKIIDFGLASKLDASSPLRVMYGTPEFVAPEVISYEPVGPATDMWSIGVICYILLSGESPFQGGSDSETLALVTAAEWEFVDESFEDITEQAKDFISSLLHKDTRRRMSCEEALFHSWMVAFKSEQPNTAKNLSKEKMKKFLARQKWKKTGKAMLALKRMSMLTKADNSASLPSSAHEHALKSLEKKMQLKPEFTKSPFDLSVFEDSTAQFFCQIAGYPDPEVVWSREGEPLEESEGSVKIEYEEDGTCVLTLENASLQHSGTYSCRATNIHGEALCSAKLTVVDQEDAMMS
ncbi:myosin light chain kinase, smooth muscle [Electrophorus electricus]|uniref:Myosin, light chain kinase 5 n=1 Tax=Electrophorus electricus TaxID=8005 RepID=A0A4W4G5X3_ELEEL|nr:myosin light chain kinase, smooth muscle [Electrophorus electricus]